MSRILDIFGKIEQRSIPRNLSKILGALVDYTAAIDEVTVVFRATASADLDLVY